MEKEIILNKIKDIAVEYNIHILSGQLNKYRLDDLFVLEVGEVVNEEIKKDFQTTFYDKHKIKVSLNNISKPLKDKINVLFMTKNEIKKTIFYSYVIKHYDYTRYLTKQFKRTLNKEKKHTDHRFMDYKRIEMTLSNTALKYYVEESVMKLDFHFKIREIYLDELFLNEYILPIIEGVFLDSASMSHELKSIIYGSEINFDAINRVIKFDPITISKFTNSTMINKNIRTKRNEVIPCSEVKNYLNGNVILTHYSSNYATRYNVQLENHLLKKGIYSREFYKISAHRDFKSITDQNMDMFLSNSFHFENFIEKTNLLPLKNKLKLLSLMSDMMKYIETEYKKIIRPIIFPVEDLLIDLTYNAIIELLVQNKVSLGDNYKLNSEARINPKNGNKRGIKDIPFYEYNSIVVSLIQKKNSSSLASLLPAYNDFKGEWTNIRYFVSSENNFWEEVALSKNDISELSSFDMIDIYSGSIRFKFDLNFILRKLSFSGLVSLIHTIDFPNEYNHDEYNHDHKYITLMKYILSEVSEADFKHLTDFRNAVSHHDLMLNSLDLSVEEYEKKLNSIINIFKDNKIQSYSFQFDRNIDIKNMFESKLYGLISSYEKKMTNRNFGKFRNLMKFISQNYNSVFGRDILVEIINKQNPSIKKQEQEFTMTDLPISIEFLKDIFDDENGEILEMMYESN